MYSKEVGGNIAKACTHNARVSVKNAKPVCRAVRGIYLERAKKFLEDVVKQRRNIGGKYYTKSTTEILNLIKSAEKNAEFKNLDLKNVYIAHISALDGTRMLRRRHKNSLGMKLKTANLEIILKEKGGLERVEKTEKTKKDKIKEQVKKAESEKSKTKEEEKVKKEVKPEQKAQEKKEAEQELKKQEKEEEETEQKEKQEKTETKKGKEGQKQETKKETEKTEEKKEKAKKEAEIKE